MAVTIPILTAWGGGWGGYQPGYWGGGYGPGAAACLRPCALLTPLTCAAFSIWKSSPVCAPALKEVPWQKGM